MPPVGDLPCPLRRSHLPGVQMRETRSTVEATDQFVELIYELLDAHADTSQLAQGLGCEIHWAAHLDYLQRLQRIGRALLAAGIED